MAKLLRKLHDRKLIQPPEWLIDNCCYLTTMGSVAYGVESYERGDLSDFDVYGVCIPPKQEIFPHLKGEIIGFGRQKQRFEQWQQHHILDQDALGGKGRMYDFSIYSIVKYFTLLMENNPNIVDSVFTYHDCVLHITQVGNIIRENRKKFLHKGCWHKFKGYAYSQMHKMRIKEPEGKRAETVEKYGYDTKFAYHVVRLLDEVEQILVEGDIDLKRNNDQLKSIRRGEWKFEEIIDHFTRKEAMLEEAYHKSILPWGPDEGVIKGILLECLEAHYGSLSNCLVVPERMELALREIKAVCEKVGI